MAKSKYEQAISTAKRNGLLMEGWMSIREIVVSTGEESELVAHGEDNDWNYQNDTSWGKYHIEKSIKLYGDWGCKAKVTHLTEKYSDLLSS